MYMLEAKKLSVNAKPSIIARGDLMTMTALFTPTVMSGEYLRVVLYEPDGWEIVNEYDLRGVLEGFASERGDA